MGSFELTILDFIQEHLRSGIGDTLMPMITMLGNGGILWILLTLLLLLLPKYRKVGVALGVSLILDLIFCNIMLKPLIARVRPFDVNTAIELLIASPLDFSFPSGHTAAAFTSTAALYFSRSKLWIPVLLLSVLIGFSRLYLYVHYPSDVLGGAFLGIVFGFFGTLLTNQLYKKRKQPFK